MERFAQEISILGVCILLSAFFSGSESALFSLTKADLHLISHSENRRERSLHRLMKDPQRILLTILIGNLFVNLAVSALATRLFLSVWDQYGHIFSIIIVTPMIVIFCEIVPKSLAMSSYRKLSRLLVPPLLFFHKLLIPLRYLLMLFTDAMIGIFHLDLSHGKITKDELGHAVRLGEERGVIRKEEGDFIKNVLRFSKRDGYNVMFPRNSAVFMPLGTSVKDALRLFLEHKVIRIPVYRDDLDHVVGVVDSRELIPCRLGYRKPQTINSFVSEIHFFPASRDLHDLLSDFLTGGIQIAILVDEYGGTAGVVTLNKLLSELMGRDLTRWDDNLRNEVRKLGVGAWIVPGTMQIDDFNNEFKEAIESDDSDTVGGYIIEKLSYIPKRGVELKIAGHLLRVRLVRKNKIESVEVIDLPGGEESGT
ncbi:MAG: HlyC/CorC family transporter [Spirochaetes bacterium]|nr:HlyC/CorC family transporter [Spirochaetota bacterium]